MRNKKAEKKSLLTRSFLIFLFFDLSKSDCSFHCEAYDCPCECIKNEVICEDKNLTQVIKFPSHVNYAAADFGNNKIASVTRHQFRHRSWNQLEVLMLSRNVIGSVEDFSFGRLNKLERLYLNNNEIKFIKEQTFSGLKKLRKLYLNNNKIKILLKKTFEGIHKTLELLYLQENEIREIEEGTFSRLNRLQTLDLTHNQIRKLDSQFLSRSTNLVHLFLENNPWDCNKISICQSYPVISKLQFGKPKLRFFDNLFCSYPVENVKENMKAVFKITDCSVKRNNTQTVPAKEGGKNCGHQVFICSKSLLLFQCLYILWLLIFL